MVSDVCCPRANNVLPPLLLQSLKLLGELSEEQSSCTLQLAAQVNFRLDKGQACADAYDKLKAAGQVRAPALPRVCDVCACVLGGRHVAIPASVLQGVDNRCCSTRAAKVSRVEEQQLRKGTPPTCGAPVLRPAHRFPAASTLSAPVSPLQVSTLEQKTNFLAAYVSAGLSAQLPQLMSQLGIKPRDSFEVGFNRATGLAAAGELEAAETAVKAAYKQGEVFSLCFWGQGERVDCPIEWFVSPGRAGSPCCWQTRTQERRHNCTHSPLSPHTHTYNTTHPCTFSSFPTRPPTHLPTVSVPVRTPPCVCIPSPQGKKLSWRTSTQMRRHNCTYSPLSPHTQHTLAQSSFTPSHPSTHPPTHCSPPPRVHIVPTGEEALLEDEYTEEEVLGELAPLTVLLGFLLIASGHNEEAVERLQPIIAGELPQREVAAIAANNWAVACFNTGERVGVQGRVLRVGCSGTRVWGGVVLGGCFWGSKLNWCRSGGGGNRGQQLGGHVLAARVRL